MLLYDGVHFSRITILFRSLTRGGNAFLIEETHQKIEEKDPRAKITPFVKITGEKGKRNVWSFVALPLVYTGIHSSLPCTNNKALLGITWINFIAQPWRRRRRRRRKQKFSLHFQSPFNETKARFRPPCLRFLSASLANFSKGQNLLDKGHSSTCRLDPVRQQSPPR